MENKIEVFQNEQFGAVRITLIDGEPWFAASDVCKAFAKGVFVPVSSLPQREPQKGAQIA